MATETPNQLADCTKKNTPRWSLNGMTYDAKCVDVYDGDSITLVFEMYGSFYQFLVRMHGYDTPELRPRHGSPEQRELQVECARKVKRSLSDMIMNKIVRVECKGQDKYGRILGVVYAGDVNINEEMLKLPHCRPYRGGKRLPWHFS